MIETVFNNTNNLTEKEVLNAIEFVRKFGTETNKIEIKKASSGFPKKCYDTISSFSNTSGGIIIFGIDEEKNFETIGVYDVSDLQNKISAMCTDSMFPVVRCDFLPIEFEGKSILAVKIDELLYSLKPCFYKPKGLNKGSYVRVGDRDEIMTDYEIYSIQSYNEGIKEDLRLNKDSDISDFSSKNIRDYIRRIRKDKPNLSKFSDEKILKLCGIVREVNGKSIPTLTGTMIFGEYPQSFYPQLFIACAVIPGVSLGEVGSRGERFLDNKRVEGNIEQMLEGTLNFLENNMRKAVIIDSNTAKRKDVLEYPMLALREAIANALIHRDYSSKTENAYIQVYMYSDRIVIQNPGSLYGINKLEKLGTDTIMESRNPNIVRVLEDKSSVIENRHSGIPTMKREMRKLGLPDPEFEEERGTFKVTFRKSFNKANKTSAQVQANNINKISKSSVPVQASNTNKNEKVSVPVSNSSVQVQTSNINKTNKSSVSVKDSNTNKKGKVSVSSLNSSAQVQASNINKINKSSVSVKDSNSNKKGKVSVSSLNSSAQVQASNINKINKSSVPVSNSSAQVQVSNINNMSKKVLEFCTEPKSIKEILKFLNLKSREYLRKNIIVPLIKSGDLKYTNEKSINASNQKYVRRK